MSDEQNRRRTDRWFGCLTRLWDWVDARDIDKHAVAVVIMAGTVKVTTWAMAFAQGSTRPGLEVAAILGSVLAPYMALQAAAISFYFKART